MDTSNVSDLRQMCPEGLQYKIYSFASESVPDPWYTGDFEETYRRVQEGCQAWLERLKKESEGGKYLKFYEKYRVYLTRPRLELLAVVSIVFCAVLVFFSKYSWKRCFKS